MPLINLSEETIVAARAALLLAAKDEYMGGPTLGELADIKAALKELSQISEESILDFWKNMTLGLKNELVIRGDRIAALQRFVEQLEAALLELGKEGEANENLRHAQRDPP
jgi:hypothetical protein